MNKKMNTNRNHVSQDEQNETIGPSQTIREELKEERFMGTDVERLHSEGDEPDLDEFLRTQERKKSEKQ